MKASDLKEIMDAVVEGEADIEVVWQHYGDEIEAINDVSNLDEFSALIYAYVYYSKYLVNGGYFKNGFYYAEAADEKLESYRARLDDADYKELKDSTLFAVGNALNYANKNRLAYYVFKELHKLMPEVDLYKTVRDSCFEAWASNVACFFTL